MKYIIHKRFRSKAICGEVNLPYGTELEAKDNLILFDGQPLCYTTSQNAYDYMARNDDGNGLERGKLTQSIIKTLSKLDNAHQTRWDKVWGDPLCQKFKRPEHKDFWVWNYNFYNANIEDLRYIAKLVGERGVA